VARTSEWTPSDVQLHAQGSRFTLGPLHIDCPLAGEHQVENAVAATVALIKLGLPEAAIEAGIRQARWPGRLEQVSRDPEIILDGAHNPAGGRALAAYIDRFYSGRKVRMIYGAMRDKAVEEVCGILFPRAQEVIVTAPHQPRALYPEAILKIADHPAVRTAASLEDALQLIRPGAPDEVTFITGSLYLVGEALALLGPKA